MGCSLPELKHGLKNKQLRAGQRKGVLIFNALSQIWLFVSSRNIVFRDLRDSQRGRRRFRCKLRDHSDEVFLECSDLK